MTCRLISYTYSWNNIITIAYTQTSTQRLHIEQATSYLCNQISQVNHVLNPFKNIPAAEKDEFSGFIHETKVVVFLTHALIRSNIHGKG